MISDGLLPAVPAPNAISSGVINPIDFPFPGPITGTIKLSATQSGEPESTLILTSFDWSKATVHFACPPFANTTGITFSWVPGSKTLMPGNF